MTDVLIVCVRDDEVRAKALADMFERAGYSVGGAPADDAALRGCAAVIVLWSQASIRSRPFLDAAQRAVNAGKAVLACLIDPPPASSRNQSPTFDLHGWEGDAEDPALDPLYFAVDRMAQAAGLAPAAPYEEEEAFAPPRAPAALHDAVRQRPQAPRVSEPRAAEMRAPEIHAYEPHIPETPANDLRARRPAAYPAQAHDAVSAEALRWRAIRHSRDPASFLHYLAEYGPEGVFSELAELRLKQLQEANAVPLKAAARAAAQQDQAPRRAAAAAQPIPLRREPPMRVEKRPEQPSIDLSAPPAAPRAEPYAQQRPEPRSEPHYEPPHPAHASAHEPRRREPDHRLYDSGERRGGGALRLLIVFLILGAGAVGAGMYLGQGQQLPAGQAEAAATPAPPEAAAPEAAPEPLAPTGEANAMGGPTASEEAAFDRPQQQPSPAAPPPAPRFEPVAAPAADAVPLMPQPMAPAAQRVAALETPPAAPALVQSGAVVWAQRASPNQIGTAYPAAARNADIAGSVVLHCVIGGDYHPSCTIVSETPTGRGFGEAALRLAREYRAGETLDNGDASIGAEATLAIRFQPAGDRR
ncbi:MAG: hypothetical protein AB7L65_01335 [Hyphomonadaceae bacterium]